VKFGTVKLDNKDRIPETRFPGLDVKNVRRPVNEYKRERARLWSGAIDSVAGHCVTMRHNVSRRDFSIFAVVPVLRYYQ